MQSLLIVDYDRTLFDSARYELAIRAVLHQKFGLDPSLLAAEVAKPSGVGGFKLFEFLAMHGIAQAQAVSAIQESLGGTSFVFPDTADFLQRWTQDTQVETMIITVGSTDYQQLKLSEITARFPHLPSQVIGINKGTWLEQQWLQHEVHRQGARLEFQGNIYANAIIMDDRLDTFTAVEASPLVHAVHVVRKDAKYQQTSGAYHVVPDLSVATTLIMKLVKPAHS